MLMTCYKHWEHSVYRVSGYVGLAAVRAGVTKYWPSCESAALCGVSDRILTCTEEEWWFSPFVQSYGLENTQEFEILSKANRKLRAACQASSFLQGSEEFVFLLFHSDLGKCMALLLKSTTKTKTIPTEIERV